MWKPGTERPSPRAPKTETPENYVKEAKSSEKKAPSSSAKKKRLSGATMNMRFMKRKKETDEYEEERRKAGIQNDGGTPIAGTTTATNPNHKQTTMPTTPETSTPKKDNEEMDIDDDDASSSDECAEMTTLGLHGMQAMLPGRRSFGGFNPAVEDAWEKSTAAIENRSLEPSKRISDEELLRQYEAIVKERSGSSKPIGNLNGKKKRGKQNKTSLSGR